MALIKCHECGNDVSTEAASCPKCGAKVRVVSSPIQPKNLTPWQIIFGLFFGVAVIWWLASGNDKTETKAPDSTKSDAECLNDLQCAGDKGIVAAGVYCKSFIEKLASHSVRWTDGTFETKFSQFRWLDQASGKITYIGDKAEFQNGFGAFTPVTYECDLDSDGKTVLDVRVNEGRL